MSDDIIIFDRQRLRANRDRAAGHMGHDFLHRWCADNLSARLTDVKRNFPLALSIGASGSDILAAHEKIGTLIPFDLSARRLHLCSGPGILGDEEFLPFAPRSLDLVLSPLALHTVNDLPGALLQIRQTLRPDGLFLAALLGGETLHELRHAMAEAETVFRGGLSPRVFPFADKPQMGSLLQRAGFSLLVVDSETVTVTYDDIFRLMQDVRLMGESNIIVRRDRSYPGKTLFLEAARIYQDKFAERAGRITATFEVIFMIGWSPHDSQQKPLRPGSAAMRLADALTTREIGTGEKTGA